MFRYANFSLLFVVTITLSTSCVSKKKFNALNDSFIKCQEVNDNLTVNINSLENLLKDKRTQISAMHKSLDSLQELREDLYKKNISLELMRKKSENDLILEINDITKELNKTISQYNDLVERAKQKEEFNKKLMLELEQNSSSLVEKERRLNEMALKVRENELATRLLREKIMAALTGYSSEDIQVEMQNGKIHVLMNDKLLFKSGRTDVNENGKSVLYSIAQSLKNIHDFDVYVEGHTDDLPIKTNCFNDNWDLSVLRATSVVRYLVFQGGMNPSHIIASGRGPYSSIKSNNTPEGRAVNRRTEIILIPKIGQLLDIINK